MVSVSVSLVFDGVAHAMVFVKQAFSPQKCVAWQASKQL